ncbi:MAG: DUF4126 family protein [Rubrobacteraceae bacterium]|jgi:uncharacterized membrane protein|nr:DUF4126 family protein [Rubrobacteraceae bacterium]
MSAYRRTLNLGAISGLRSMSGPAFVSLAARNGNLDLEGTPLAFLGSSRLSKVIVVMELGELVGDKLPKTPSRSALPPLLGRAASGALVGAAVFVSDGRRATTGAALGSTAAIVAALAGERLRALAVEKTGLLDPVIALAEDATVLLIGLRSLKHIR